MDIFVAILEDDVFSRQWMSLMMVRDWRTRLVGEFSNQAELCNYLNNDNLPIDVLILDVDLFSEIFSLEDICEKFSQVSRNVKILLTGVEPSHRIMRQVENPMICGYVLKDEVGFSLSWVISFVSDGHWVVTPGVSHMANAMGMRLPSNKLILDGRKILPGFTDHEADVARMAIIFSLGRRDLADELKISDQWSYGLVSELYKKMGLADILSGDEDLFSYIGDNPIIRSHFEEIMAQLGASKKARDLETLAFHFLTMPEIVA